MTAEATPTQDDLALAAMQQIIGEVEIYRALLEACGFSRWSAEAMSVQFHGNLCNELDRRRVRSAELERATQ